MLEIYRIVKLLEDHNPTTTLNHKENFVRHIYFDTNYRMPLWYRWDKVREAIGNKNPTGWEKALRKRLRTIKSDVERAIEKGFIDSDGLKMVVTTEGSKISNNPLYLLEKILEEYSKTQIFILGSGGALLIWVAVKIWEGIQKMN